MKSLLANPIKLKVLSMMLLLLLSFILVSAQTHESNGTNPLQDITVSSSFVDCRATDSGTNFVYERPTVCTNPLFIHFENGETRTLRTQTSEGFALESGTPQNMRGFTVCAASGNAYWIRNMGETLDALYAYIEFSGMWMPRKADNSFDTSKRKEFGPVRVCKGSRQIADGGGGDGGDFELPPGTPIFIDLNGDGVVRLTDRAGGVLFDLNANGVKEQIPWMADSDDGLLVWDLDETGEILNGKYLFGNYTMRLTSNGYDALRKFDENGDKIINYEDGIFPGLKVWRDLDHDGISDPGELSPFSSIARSISVEYKESRRKDQHGNEFRYRAEIELLDGRKGFSFDVIFVDKQPQ